ncbi:MAG: Hpt domain-containing protein, partial [Desulfosarcina sp.]
AGFAEQNAAAEAALDAQLALDDDKAMQLLAHSLKGSAANIGAVELSAAAGKLERALTDSEIRDQAAIAAHTAAVKRRLSEALAGIETLAPLPMANISQAPTTDPADRREKLERLAEALQQADPEAIPGRFAAVRSLLPAPLANELNTCIETYEYEKALAYVHLAIGEP